MRPGRGFLDDKLLRMVRGARVKEVTADGRPAEVDFTFVVPLEDPSLLWMRVQAGGALAPWSPPAVGEDQVLPSVALRRAPPPPAPPPTR